MKRFFTVIASALLVLSAVSCSKASVGFPPYYKISRALSITSGTFGSSDFSKISAVVEPYINVEYQSEGEAVAAYNNVLSSVRNVEYSAPSDSYYEIFLVKYISHEENEYTIRYEADPDYRSPVAHRWDAQGSRDL